MYRLIITSPQPEHKGGTFHEVMIDHHQEIIRSVFQRTDYAGAVVSPDNVVVACADLRYDTGTNADAQEHFRELAQIPTPNP